MAAKTQYVYQLDNTSTDMLGSSDTTLSSLKAATECAQEDLENGDSWCGDASEAIIYKLVPVRRLVKPTEVIVEDL